jgi:hypothetical protein
MNGSSIAYIRELNDAFRKTFADGKMVMLAGSATLVVVASYLIVVVT